MSNENETDNSQPLQPEALAPTEPFESEAAPAKKIPPKKAVADSAESAANGAEAGEKKVPPKKADAAPPPPPPELGVYGKQLASAGFHPIALAKDAGGMEMMDIKTDELLSVAAHLKTACQMDLLVSVSGVDWKDRLEAVYHLYSTHTFEALALKVTAVNERIPSVVSIWAGADWHEREAYDLYGILFEGHPNLKRILMPADWVGYPMRKDYVVDDPRLVWNER